MRYLVDARVKPGCESKLLQAIDNGTVGAGSVAGDEYACNMQAARSLENGSVRWVETCFCATPLAEERAYWEEFFELIAVRDAHLRANCRDLNGTEPWACCHCDCTRKLDEKLAGSGCSFLALLRESAGRPG